MIPSLLQIPSAVSDSKLHSVLPNNGKGDFTFDRSTGATRINKDGLIEEVGYFSSELVQNGNFSELGSELIVNGDFATNSNWDLGAGWTINDGKLRADDVSLINTFQAKVYTSGKTYKVTYTISDYVKGEVRFQLGGGGSTVNGTARGANGTYTEYVVATDNHTSARFRALSSQGGFTASIDNVSVKQVDPNDRWVTTSPWTKTDRAFYDDTSGNRIQQTGLDLKSGKKYKLTFDIEITTANQAYIWIGNSGGSTNYTGTNYVFYKTGSYSVIFTLSGSQTSLAFYGSQAGGAFYIDNISLVEVQGDRPRLSYDITNGVVEKQPHLLLEPSSTNLVTFSEDFSQSVWNKANISVSNNTIVSPDGTQNASTITTSNTSHSLFFNFTSVASTQYTFSFYAKRGTMTDLKYRVYDLSNDGDIVAPTSYYAQTNSDRWERIILTFTTPSGCTSARVYPVSNSGVTGTMFLFGCMVEQQAFSTSYIPTAGTTITRAAETCNNSKPSINSTEGVLYAEIASLVSDDSVFRTISIGDGGTINNSIRIAFTSTNNQIVVATRVSNADQSYITHTLSDAKEFNKIAYQSKSNEFKLYVNGVLISTDTSGSVPSAGTLTTLNFDRQDGANDFYGKVKGLAVYNEALSESQLMQLTGVTASSIYNNFVTRTASFTVEALNEVKKVIDNL